MFFSLIVGGQKLEIVRSTNVTQRHCQAVHSVQISSHCNQSFTTEIMYDKANIGQKTTETEKKQFSYAQHDPEFLLKAKNKINQR